MRLRKLAGFSLLEVMVVIVLASIMLTLGFRGLTKARLSGSSRGMATSVAAELRLAREKAIAKGSPVAVVFQPGVSRSLFFLEGETLPAVTRAVNYEGDYPNGTICVATYAGPSFAPLAEIPGSKSLSWKSRLNSWLPADYRDHKVFMFTPNGAVITNDIPGADGTYRVIVSAGADVSGNTLLAAGEPETVAISASGAVETFGRLLGSNGSTSEAGGISPAVTAPPAPVSDYVEQAPVIVESRVTPKAELVDGQLVHVLDKGEYLTLEVFARSADGRPLYAGWNDDPVTKESDPNYKGAFSVPGAELERMEFYPEYNVADNGQPPDIKENIWRSVWTWTPPAKADAGDQYDLAVDVTDAKKRVKAALPELKPVVISPPGEIIFESNRTGRWQLFTMWADGSRTTRLTTGDHDYRCASATADGKLIAYEMDGNQVWVMNADGTGQTRISTNGKCPTISPTGNCIAFMQGSNLRIRRLDGASSSDTRGTVITQVNGAPDPSNRIAFSADGKWVYYTCPDRSTMIPPRPAGSAVEGARLSFAGGGVQVVETQTGDTVDNIASSPMVGGLYMGRKGQLFYHADRDDPYLGYYQTSGGAPGGVFHIRESQHEFEAFPAISPNEDLLLYCEQQPDGKYQIFASPMNATWNRKSQGVAITGEGENLRPAWIHQGGKL